MRHLHFLSLLLPLALCLACSQQAAQPGADTSTQSHTSDSSQAAHVLIEQHFTVSETGGGTDKFEQGDGYIYSDGTIASFDCTRAGCSNGPGGKMSAADLATLKTLLGQARSGALAPAQNPYADLCSSGSQSVNGESWSNTFNTTALDGTVILTRSVGPCGYWLQNNTQAAQQALDLIRKVRCSLATCR